MSTQTMTFSFVLVTLIVFSLLIWLAVLGYTFAYLLLGALGTVILMSIGLIYNLFANKIQADNQQKSFMENAKENLSIMSAMQSIQNKQNSSIMNQLGRVARLPEPNQIGLEFDDGIFEELEQ